VSIGFLFAAADVGRLDHVGGNVHAQSAAAVEVQHGLARGGGMRRVVAVGRARSEAE
jgi:hypothetical protein